MEPIIGGIPLIENTQIPNMLLWINATKWTETINIEVM